MRIFIFGSGDEIFKKDSNKLKYRIRSYEKLIDKIFFLIPSVEKKCLKISSKIKICGSGGSKKFFQLFNIYKIARKNLKEGKFDIISSQEAYFLGSIAYFLAKKFKIGLEIQIHGFEKFYGLRKALAKFVLPRADSVRTVSQRFARKLKDELGVDEDKITVVPIYTDIKKLLKNKNKKAKGTENFIFLTVSRLVEVKNIALQIRALKEITEEREDVELWIAGDGPEKNNLEKLTADLGLKNFVSFLGWHREVEKLYPQADCFVLTSNSEGWGLVAVEAASFSMPIIMTDVGCAGEVVRDKESGLIIPVGDKKALVSAMEKIISDKELRKKFGQNAFEAIKKLPNQEETLKLYKKSWRRAKK